MTAGLPDLEVFYALGKTAFFEIKIPPDRLSERQKEFRDICLNWRIPYCIVKNGEEFAQDIRDLRMEGDK